MNNNTKSCPSAIREKLTAECSFLHAFDTMDYTNHSPCEMGYTRVYYRPSGWYESWFSVHPMIITRQRVHELFAVTAALTKAFPTLFSLVCFCSQIAENRNGEYNLFYEGEEAQYWIRVIDRTDDYNLYIHSIVLEDD